MKLLDKLKNALFEEEYVEVEEKPRKKEIKREKTKKEKSIKKAEDIHEEKPIAKKIVQKKEKQPEIIDKKLIDNDYTGETLAYDIEKEEKSFKFNMVSDDEFEPKEKVDEKQQNDDKFKKKIEKKLYEGKKKKSKPYGIDDMDIPQTEYGAYEKKEDRTYFRPSPIISPIYGVLDKNYTKDEIIPKREIRLTSAYNRENINVDDVRKKAFGTLTDDIDQKLEDYSYDDEEIDDGDTSFLDLSKEEDTPEVKKVTVGDAEEYFEDLGLEYNVDYKDTSKEKATGRRTKIDYGDEEDDDSIKIEEDNEDISSQLDEEIEIDDNQDTDNDDDNLFDLIDSMYDKE